MKNLFRKAAESLMETAVKKKEGNDVTASFAFTDVSNLLYELSQSETLPTIDDLISIIKSSLVGNNIYDASEFAKNVYQSHIKYIGSQLPVLMNNLKRSVA